MDPALRITRNLHTALTNVANLFTQLGVSPQDVFIHPTFASALAAELKNAIADAAKLHEGSAGDVRGQERDVMVFVNEIGKRNLDNLKAVNRDSETLHDMDCNLDSESIDRRSLPHFVSTSDRFALNLTHSLSQVLDFNVAALQQRSAASSPSSLRTSQPELVRYLAACLHQVVDAHVKQDISYKDTINGLREELAQGQAERTQFASEKARLEERFASETAVANAKHEKDLEGAQKIIAALMNEIRVQQGIFSSQMRELQAKVDQTRQEADHSRMRADSEESERKRLALENQNLRQQIEELNSKLQMQALQQSTGRRDAEAQTTLTIRVPGMQTPTGARNPPSATPPSGVKRNYQNSHADENGPGSEAAIPRVQQLSPSLQVNQAAIVDLSSSEGVPANFTRQSIKAILGGNATKALVVRVRNPTSLASQHNIQTYLCVTRSRYASLPSEPGKHAFLAYDFDIRTGNGVQDSDTAANSTYRLGATVDTPCHLFVGSGTDNEVFHYYGQYRLTKAKPLTKEEWAHLPPFAQKANLQLQSKEKGRTVSASDIVNAPCIRLECIGFDAAFYSKLVEKRAEFLEDPEALSPERHDSNDAPSKRRKVSDRQREPVSDSAWEMVSPHNIDDMYA